MSDYEAAQRRRDVIVGIFVIVGLAALGWMIFKFGDLPTAVTRMRSFEIYVQFPTAPGVEKDTPVRFAGYQIGRVTHVMAPEVRTDLNTGKEYHQTLCVLSINNKYVDIPCNVQVKLMTRGLGSSYLELKVDPAKLPAPLQDPNDPYSCFLRSGMLLQGSTGMTSEFFPEESQQMLNDLVMDIRTFIGNANDVIGDPNNKRNIKATLANLTDATGSLTVALREAALTMQDARKTLEDFRSLASTGTDTLKNVDAKAERLVVSMLNTTTELSKAISQMRLALEKINHGDGAAGRFINDGRLYESLLENTTQLNVLLKDFKELIDKISSKGLRSVY
ncbi:MAG TPA: MlaD family protein [Sedimentisphaerales bacterium]|nr:MCE family protein [Phycisphaerae bacterium]HON93546.1 MlaD family protein [Sedimentisphaerales bacterium]HQI27451.1 MlaD family protein [Sedimentisphaerales bacterium]